MSDTEHMIHLNAVLSSDETILHQKEKIYGGSWKKRGGQGAFFVLARKWDALENMVSWENYDIIESCLTDDDQLITGDGSVLEQIRDLRRYLALVECEVLRQHTALTQNPQTVQAAPVPPPAPEGSSGVGYVPGTPEDGGHHAKVGFLVRCVEEGSGIFKGFIYTVLLDVDNMYGLKDVQQLQPKTKFRRMT